MFYTNRCSPVKCSLDRGRLLLGAGDRAEALERAGSVRLVPLPEQPFHTDIAYYEGRADGIATVNGVTVDEARLDLARRHGFASWDDAAPPRRGARATAASRRRRSCSPTARSRTTTATGSSSCSTRTPSSSRRAGRTGTTCSAWPATSSSSGCCSSAAPTRTAATTTAGRSSTRPATRTAASWRS